jgi:perosamine synthetase
VDTSTFVEQVVEAIRQVAGSGPVALHEPRFAGNEWAYLKECLDSTFVSSVGKFVDRFEADLAAFTGARHAVAVVNGTAALHIALTLAGVEAGDEVLIPALTFVATANAVAYCGATCHFVDSEERTLGLDTAKLRAHLQAVSEQRDGQCVHRASGQVIRALVPMHTFGHPADLDGLLSVAHDFNLALVEDAAESLGSDYHGRHTGTFGRFGTLSFNGNKTITTGGGGAILTNDPELASVAKHITTTAKLPHRWAFEHDRIGYNYRLPNINAALGCAQLEQLPAFLEAKRRLFQRYQEAFAPLSGIAPFQEPEGCRSNYWLQTLVLAPELADRQQAILQASNDAGLMTRPAWTLMSRLRPYRDCPAMNLACAESLAARLINVPSSAQLADVRA